MDKAGQKLLDKAKEAKTLEEQLGYAAEFLDLKTNELAKSMEKKMDKLDKKIDKGIDEDINLKRKIAIMDSYELLIPHEFQNQEYL